MITLSKRLSMVADMVPPCDTLADVGTDHAYLPVWLLQQGRARYVLASDIHSGPLQKARESVEAYALENCMELFLADGLRFPGAERAEVITICGMGGETMISILEAAPWIAENRRLILQPQSKLQELERWLQAHQFTIEDAKLCLDCGKLYLALSIACGGDWASSEQLLQRRNDPLFLDYIRQELRKARTAREGLLKSSAAHDEMLDKMQHRISVLEQYEKETQL